MAYALPTQSIFFSLTLCWPQLDALQSGVSLNGDLSPLSYYIKPLLLEERALSYTIWIYPGKHLSQGSQIKVNYKPKLVIFIITQDRIFGESTIK